MDGPAWNIFRWEQILSLEGLISSISSMHVYASLFVHSNTSTSQAGAWESVGPLRRQNHIRNQNDRIDRGRKERKERKQLSIAVGWREKEGECGRRETLNSGRVGVGERVNACVVALLCPAPEWSVSKLSSNWWFTPPRPYQLKWANNTLSDGTLSSNKSWVELCYSGSKVGWSVLEVCGYVQENTCPGRKKDNKEKVSKVQNRVKPADRCYHGFKHPFPRCDNRLVLSVIKCLDFILFF